MVDVLSAIAQERCAAHREPLEGALSPDVPLELVLAIAEDPRERYFGRKIQVHILDNIRNGNCAEDCGYCAQRKGGNAGNLPAYSIKDEEEILLEAERAFKAGAFRFCLVTAGTGPTETQVLRYADLVRKIKRRFPMRICLSAGIIRNKKFAETLAAAGLDRYNHNLNTSDGHTNKITRTHSFADRVQTIEHLRSAGISVCSGVIVGLGESPGDLIDVALRLRDLAVPSIPVNFFLPIPGHAISSPQKLTPEYCLRVLCMFRIANPRAEIRLAAGREIHLGERQGEALRVANSLFVAGYLNVKGSDAAETYSMILREGYVVDADRSDLLSMEADSREDAQVYQNIHLKTMEDLRPFRMGPTRTRNAGGC